MTIKSNKSERTFKEGQVFNLNVPERGILYLAGGNGCGKSSLMHAVRANKDSLKDINTDIADGLTNDYVNRMKDTGIECTELEYDEVFSLDAISDDPTSFHNAATAAALVQGGGLQSTRISRGQRSMMMILRFVEKITKYLTKTYGSVDEWLASGRKGLVILDEMDEGLEMAGQLHFNTMLYNAFIKKFGVSVIAITHNPLVMLGKTPVEVDTRVYNLAMSKTTQDLGIKIESADPVVSTTVQEYITMETGHNITVEKVERPA